jgi:O-antigen ligase
LLAAATALQLVPLPYRWLNTISPTALEVVNAFALTPASLPGRHPSSISPLQTATALALFISFALLILGSARLFTLRGPRVVANAVAIIGVLLSLIAIIQKPLFGKEIYGFWTPSEGDLPFGPFVNNNHFAGWMLMALPLTIGLLSGGVARAMRHVKPTFRDRLLWLSSPDASRLLMLAGAVLVTALSVMLTLSRSGIAAMLFALMVLAMVAMRRQKGMARRTLVTCFVILVVIAIPAWAGVDRIASHFAETDWGLNNRWGAWLDALAVASRFPLTGTGLNTYNVAMISYQQHDLAHYYNAAHNDYLQLTAEGGLLLTVPALLCVLAFTRLVWRRFKQETSTSGYWLRVGAVTGLCAVALQETVDFSLQMPGNAVLFAVLCGIALHRSPDRTSPSASSKVSPPEDSPMNSGRSRRARS